MPTSRKTAKDAKTVAPKVASAAKKPAPNPPTSATSPSNEAIARRAYELWLERGGDHGRDAEDWRRAEEELRHAR